MGNYVKIDVSKSSDNAGIGGKKKDELILIDLADIATLPNRDGSGIVITDNIVMKEGKYAVRLYVTQSTIKAGADAEGDPDAKGIMQSVEAEHPGDAIAVREFRYNWMNKNILVLIRKCGSSKISLYGDECAPLQMIFKAEDDKDKNKSTFTFKSSQKGPDVADYQGTITFDTIMGTIPADSISPDVSAGSGRYQLTNGTQAAIDLVCLVGAINDGVYTLIGSGGNHPSIITSGTGFMLKGGILWTALAGAEITLRAFEIGTGPLFFEVSRKA